MRILWKIILILVKMLMLIRSARAMCGTAEEALRGNLDEFDDCT